MNYRNAIDRLSNSLRAHPSVIMVADAYDSVGPYIAVFVLQGAPLPAVPRRFSNHRVKIVRSAPIVPHLGQTLTSWACESEQFAQSWRNRVNESISTGTQAAVVAAAAAGFLGAMIDRPLLGAAVGAAVGWATHAIWTAPQAV